MNYWELTCSSEKLTTEHDNALTQNAELVATIDALTDAAIQVCLRLDRDGVSTAGIADDIEKLQEAVNKTPAQCLRERDIEKFRAGYISALITHTEEPTKWCEVQANERIKQGNI